MPCESSEVFLARIGIFPDFSCLSKVIEKDALRVSRNFDAVSCARAISSPVVRGRVLESKGLIIKARLPSARIGDLCLIEVDHCHGVRAEVVGFNEEDIFLTPFERLYAVGPNCRIINLGTQLRVPVGQGLLGRVVDSLGTPVDGGGCLNCSEFSVVRRSAPVAMARKRIRNVLSTGVRTIDSLLTLGEGQRVGLFSAAGVGKSSLLGMIARYSKADVIVVGLVGERGREVREFLEDDLGDAISRTCVVVSTSDEPPLRRVIAAYTATAIAEYFRSQGLKVMLLMDSVTRFARALREIALSLGEHQVRAGYPPSVFDALPQLLERAGNAEDGSITAFYTILLATEQVEDPLGEELKAVLDGHIYLSSRFSQMRHFPAIDILASNSRVMNSITAPAHQEKARQIIRLWSAYESNRDLIALGAYKKGSDEVIDQAIARHGQMLEFLRQEKGEESAFDSIFEKARAILS